MQTKNEVAILKVSLFVFLVGKAKLFDWLSKRGEHQLLSTTFDTFIPKIKLLHVCRIQSINKVLKMVAAFQDRIASAFLLLMVT